MVKICSAPGCGIKKGNKKKSLFQLKLGTKRADLIIAELNLDVTDLLENVCVCEDHFYPGSYSTGQRKKLLSGFRVIKPDPIGIGSSADIGDSYKEEVGDMSLLLFNVILLIKFSS